MGYDKEKVKLLEPEQGYDMLAKEYKKFHKELDQRDKGIFQKYLPRELKGLRVLDLGGGDGRLANFFVDKQLEEYVLTDISNKMLEFGSNWYTKVRVDLEGPFPFKPESFDICLAFFIILHINNIDDFFNECFKIIKPGGRLLVLHHIENRSKIFGTARNKYKILNYKYRYEYLEEMAKKSFFDVSNEDLYNKKTLIGKLYCFSKKS